MDIKIVFKKKLISPKKSFTFVTYFKILLPKADFDL